jgi:3-hydroxyanthranilate 3,4-dioxygenase|eukprot:TRINITY_DN195_c1_g1_i1.p2 TRINITY_DN195_c1_g1~~TRINITY_DN195_c1_g1_i1.p2  ORF type:complete len:175 (-),score=74.35 TRINITY_DN195_c1_g1_i1:61-585(-)
MASKIPPPFNLPNFLANHADELKPPVCNKVVCDGEFKVMIVGGPNQRKDYHINEGSEFFYQIKGDLLLKIVDGGEFRDVNIREGDMFLLPGNVPHSPNRFADTVGLVVERERRPEETDHLRWYCDVESCRAVVYEESFHCTDLGTQLKPVIERYFGDEALRKCAKCGHVNERPA